MEDVKKTKPVKEKRKRSQGPKKDKKSEESQQQSGAGMVSHFLSQSQQIQQQEGLVLGDSHSSFVGRMAAQHLSSSSPFTTTQHGGTMTSAPSHSSLRTINLPPKKSISPSRMAALTEPKGQSQRHLALGLGQGRPWQYHFTEVPAGFQSQVSASQHSI
ncbi:uncharacterized protein LOC117333435 isoform X2 [Pecten maximus]|uniref:uncharacterized protein LOC117333435 isoform X2 n=1 Tax=Pecten maximus TaxID=6579 RepID=UPI0014581241|nr:uncharacterized protein LOC117333435 isoform X2 [Pecten maximus]